MEYTFTESGYGFTSSDTACDQYDSKDKYSKLAIGGATKFEILYVDLRNSVENYPNSNQEGAVRPPCLVFIFF